MAMLRGSEGDKRVQRTEVDTGTGTARVSGDRAAHVSRGDFVNYYKDLGISTTQGGAEDLRNQNTKFSADVSKRQGEINAATSEYTKGMSEVAAAKAKIPTFQKAYDDTWSKYQKDQLVPVYPATRTGVTLYDLKKKRFEDPKWAKYKNENADYASEVYYLPADAVTSSLPPEHYSVQQTGDGFKIVPNAGSGATENKARETAMKDFLSTSTIQLKQAFDDQAIPELKGAITQANSDVAKGEQNLVLGDANIKAASSMLKGSVDTRTADWNDIKSKYAARSQTMKDILGGLKIA